MGAGDQIMAAGQAEDLYLTDVQLGPITIRDTTGKLRWNPIWDGNPVICVPHHHPRPYVDRLRSIVTGGGALPYLQYPYLPETVWRWSGWRARDHRGRLYLAPTELDLGRTTRDQHGPFILLEPTAERKHINRRPALAFWQDLLRHLRATVDLPIVQLLHADSVVIDRRIPRIPHTTFREACGILAAASLLITTEGGLVHAAQALRTPAVVLWGGCISVDALGYPEHANVVDPSRQTPCGALFPCPHCAAAWRALDLHRVLDAVQREVATHGLPGSRHHAHG